MTFAQPEFLWGLLLIPLAIIGLISANRQRKTLMARLGNPELLQRLSSAINWRGRRGQSLLWLAALALVIIAVARPQWGSEVQIVEQEGVQVMVALDVSRSMLAQDLKPDRLTRARLEISDLMNRLQGDELGLVLFSGASFIQFPLTSDYDTARAFLQNARPEIISRPGTAIGEAIQTALSGFDEQRNNQKVIVIMTDGEDHEDDPVEVATQAAEEQDVIIYTIGFGSPQAEPIPEYDNRGERIGYKKDASGQVVMSTIDEVTLQQIAIATGGRYFRARADGSELDDLTAELDRLETDLLESRFETQQVERFQWFVALALLALVGRELIPDRRRIND